MDIEEKNIASEDSANASTENNSSVTPTESPNSEKEAEEIKDLDPRIMDIVGEDEIKTAFGKPKEESETEEEKKPEAEKAEGENQEKNEVDENQNDENQNIQNHEIQSMTPRLDKRLADKYIQILTLKGDKNIPTKEELMNDLKNYSKDQKVEKLKQYLEIVREMRGLKPSRALEAEDIEAIKDAEREEIRQEIIQEENQTKEVVNFVEFIDNHPELDETKKDGKYDPILADAVETLVYGGMSIKKAYKTVTDKIEQVKQDRIAKEKEVKNKALSGIISGAGENPGKSGELTWEDVEKIEAEDPQRYHRMLAEGKFKHLM